jgi:hypothetical protein
MHITKINVEKINFFGFKDWGSGGGSFPKFASGTCILFISNFGNEPPPLPQSLNYLHIRNIIMYIIICIRNSFTFIFHVSM